jgi:hypothetical protein
MTKLNYNKILKTNTKKKKKKKLKPNINLLNHKLGLNEVMSLTCFMKHDQNIKRIENYNNKTHIKHNSKPKNQTYHKKKKKKKKILHLSNISMNKTISQFEP